jgi:hypothetical protein
MGMSLAEQAASTRLAWEAGDRKGGLAEALELSYAVRDFLLVNDNGVSDGDTVAEDRLERITPALCALAERIAAVSRGPEPQRGAR